MHFAGACDLLRFLRDGPADLVLVLPVIPDVATEGLLLKGWCDSNFASERARSGGCVTLTPQRMVSRCDIESFVHSCPIMWYSRRQKCITLSTCEAEIIAESAMCREVLGTRNFLRELWPSVDIQAEVIGDSSAAVLIGQGQSSLRKVRHLCLADLYVTEVTEGGDVRLSQCDTKVNISDPGTKVLDATTLAELAPLMKLVDIPSRSEVIEVKLQ